MRPKFVDELLADRRRRPLRPVDHAEEERKLQAYLLARGRRLAEEMKLNQTLDQRVNLDLIRDDDLHDLGRIACHAQYPDIPAPDHFALIMDEESPLQT